MIKLKDYQLDAIKRLRSGSILCGGTGSGKSLTSLYWYKENYSKKKLYIITTAKKRDSKEWFGDIVKLGGLKEENIIVDSWNNIAKYSSVTNSIFLFDEQRLVGYGAWVKAFFKIARNNTWILLTATPGDTWMDYIPVFIANGFYQNKTEFLRRHVIFSRYCKFPKVERFIDEDRLEKCRQRVLITMNYSSSSEKCVIKEVVDYDKDLYLEVEKNRWNPYKEKVFDMYPPIKNAGEYCLILRKISNNNLNKNKKLKEIYKKFKKIIIFYNFNYELELLESFAKTNKIPFSQWNGHKHEEIVKGDTWLYFVQYAAGSEAWNCIETNVIVFYSLPYSYKQYKQSMGRIDRMNTPFKKLYYYIFTTNSKIDKAVELAIKTKKTFNEKAFATDKGVNFEEGHDGKEKRKTCKT